ncbi:lipocalin [Bizionia gelidisalsuginis]|uniref:Lipocalin n=2 Tax=Bizionia TaxID=283785 RepID=A0A8H2LMU3_9FLAO|nr:MULTISPECIES: lipocalin family protein [Bizionia]TYB76026.1 lipocalin [Bizionia saleffrena]TYC13529.1 lipocalin [Bizionia gelidisalsuginis]
MKKLSFLLLAVFLVGCGSSKVVRESKKEIKGNWVLNSVNYDNAGTYEVTLLNDASKECFEQSTWSFVPNNNTGIYSIANTNCATGDRYFNFTIQEVDANSGLYHFLLKPTDAKGKSANNAGFRFRLSQLSESVMQWQQTVSVDGSPFIINMNFTKL